VLPRRVFSLFFSVPDHLELLRFTNEPAVSTRTFSASCSYQLRPVSPPSLSSPSLLVPRCHRARFVVDPDHNSMRCLAQLMRASPLLINSISTESQS
jgi:hypothetical protein